MGILKELSGILFGRPGGQCDTQQFTILENAVGD
jgi:hypothetical protein